MNTFRFALRKHFWPISAMVFCPCHLPLSMGLISSITAGTFLGTYISSHYTAIESVLAVTFSFYFVLAFMIWAVRGPEHARIIKAGESCPIDSPTGRPVGLSTRQIALWGVIGTMAMPLLISASLLLQENVRRNIAGEMMRNLEGMLGAGSGLVWLLSISTVVMIPVMIIWITWLWIAWSKVSPEDRKAEQWQYEFESD